MKKYLILSLFIMVISFTFASITQKNAMAFGESGDGGCCGSSESPNTDNTSDDSDDSTPPPPPRPVCPLTLEEGKEFVAPGEEYTLSWENLTPGASYTFGGVALNGDDGFITYEWDPENVFLTFTLTGSNETGDCVTNVTVFKEVAAPTCTLTTDLSVVADNEKFTISWEATPDESTTYRLITAGNPDGEGVPRKLSRTYTWPEGRTDPVTFSFAANNAAGDCITSITIENEDNVTPIPACLSFGIAETKVTPEAPITLSWNTENVSAVAIDNGVGDVGVTGTNETFSAPAAEGTYTYTLTFDGQTNQSCVDTLVVEEEVVEIPGCTDPDAINTDPNATVDDDSCEYPAPLPVCVSFTATPATIVSGTEATLAWETTNATRVVINNAVGEQTDLDAGLVPVTLLADTTYKLTVFNEDQVAVDCPLVTVSVTNPTTPDITIDKRDAVDGDDTQTVGKGETAQFEIVVTNTGNEDLTDVIVTDPLTPACDKNIGALPIGENASYTCDATNVQTGFTNVASVIGLSTVDGEEVSDNNSTNVAITPDVASPTCDVFTASATNIDAGDDVTLTWETTNAATVEITGLGEVELDGNATVNPNSDATYIVSVDGQEANNCRIAIDVNTGGGSGGGGGGGGGSSSPRCEFEISDETIKSGEEITLTWETRSTRDITITDDRGNVVITSTDRLADDKDEFLDSEITLNPTRDTEYTLVAERGSRDRECTVEVEVEEDDVVVLQTRDQAPLVTGISLAEVPYTGFEAGPFMTVVFYTLLIGWALYLTYVLVIPKSAMKPVAVLESTSPQDHLQKAQSLRPDLFAAVQKTTAVSASVAAPTAAAPANLPVAPLPSAPVANTQMAATVTPADSIDAAALEAVAHNQQALLSSDAISTFLATVPVAEQLTKISEIVEAAKAQFPQEDGWVVINNDRMLSLLVA